MNQNQEKKEEIAGEIEFRLGKSKYSVNNIEKAIEMLEQASQGMKIYDKLINEIKDFVVNSKDVSEEEVNKTYDKWIRNVKYLVDSTRIKYLRLLTTEDFKKDIEFRRKVRARTDFRKKFDAKLNPALVYNKIIIHTAIPEEPFIQINIPVELGYKTYKLDELDLTNEEDKSEFITRITELETLLKTEKENSGCYMEKLNRVKKKINIYQENLQSTLSSAGLSNVKAELNQKDISDTKLNFGVVTNKSRKGLIFNFIA